VASVTDPHGRILGFLDGNLSLMNEYVGSLSALLFDYEDRREMFLRNVWLSELHGITTR
jgi:hypothetical protein